MQHMPKLLRETARPTNCPSSANPCSLCTLELTCFFWLAQGDILAVVRYTQWAWPQWGQQFPWIQLLGKVFLTRHLQGGQKQERKDQHHPLIRMIRGKISSSKTGECPHRKAWTKVFRIRRRYNKPSAVGGQIQLARSHLTRYFAGIYYWTYDLAWKPMMYLITDTQ